MKASPHLALLLGRDQMAQSADEAHARRLAAHLREEALLNREAEIRARTQLRRATGHRAAPIRARLGALLISLGERLAATRPA